METLAPSQIVGPPWLANLPSACPIWSRARWKFFACTRTYTRRWSKRTQRTGSSCSSTCRSIRSKRTVVWSKLSSSSVCWQNSESSCRISSVTQFSSFIMSNTWATLQWSCCNLCLTSRRTSKQKRYSERSKSLSLTKSSKRISVATLVTFTGTALTKR